MPFDLPPTATVLFQGDSITDAGRDRTDPADLGDGYVAFAADRLRTAHPGATVVNRGIAGNRMADLAARWEREAVAVRADLASVLIGVNDTWRRFDAGLVSPVEPWEEQYRELLTRLRGAGTAQLVLIEPFLVPVAEEQLAWRADLEPRIEAVHRLAAEFGAALLTADALLNRAAEGIGTPLAIAADGVHPTALGHQILANAWTDLVLGG
ncbi:GDSL-type esterase/lipase family protein [Kitasatospora sp. NPDC058965]|uniref:GDSL-type esterase/lipase family protein n=1 Tax=Kitasatospora sp. NPDC058965 TaxID=3346682 RepID=UPI00369FBF37